MGVIYYIIIPFDRNKSKLKIKLKISEELDSSNVLTYLTVRLKDKGLKAHLVHTHAEGPPKDVKSPNKNMLWCPYCRDWRKFVSSRYDSDTKVCKICGISTRDFYVRKFNHLWGGYHSTLKRGRRK